MIIYYLDRLTPFALIVLSVASATFLSSLLALGVFSFTLVLYVLFSFDSRLFVGTAIFMLILSAVLMPSGSFIVANETAIIAYYFLVMGILGLLIEYLKPRIMQSMRNGDLN